MRHRLLQHGGTDLPGKVLLVEDLAEVGAGDELAGRPLRCEVAQHSAQQADAVRAQRPLPKLIYDAQRPAFSCYLGMGVPQVPGMGRGCLSSSREHSSVHLPCSKGCVLCNTLLVYEHIPVAMAKVYSILLS